MSTFTLFDPALGASKLTDALLATGSGLTVSGPIVLKASGASAVNFYDGSLSALGIGAGLLLTSGTTPGTSNTMPWFGDDNSGSSGFYNGDADIDAVVNTVFQTQSYDATTLEFDVTAGASDTSVSFDLVFGSDEFPEWVDQFVDCAIFMVNGVNYALFNHDPLHPLSVVSSNLAAGYFQDNENPAVALPIEYDGVSHVLKIVAPINPGAINHIKIGIADTGDHIYDSGIFIANLTAGTIPGSGVVSPTTVCDDSNNNVTGSAKDEYFDLKGGDDIVYAGAGDDIVVAGAGKDTVYGGSGADQIKGDGGDDGIDGGDGVDTAVYAGASAGYAIAYDSASGAFTVTDTTSGASNEGIDTLKSVEIAKFADKSYALGADGSIAEVVPPPPPVANAPGLLFLTGIGAVGQTLTAQVSDADGVPANVTYSWQAGGVDLGVTGATILVGEAQVDQDISVTAVYTDLKGHAESLATTPKSISAPGDGDFTITLLNLSAPLGASVMNPLTTLVDNAIALGASPNLASIIVKSALGIDPDVELQHYDAWAALQANGSDTAALLVEKRAVQVAVMTSVGGDQFGMALTQAILLAHSNSLILNLGDETVIRDVLGLVATNPNDPNDPVNKIVHEIWDRNANIADATNVAGIETEWADMQSGLQVVLSTSIGDLSIHINQAPTGFATFELQPGVEDAAYTIHASDLLVGFSDSDGGTLTVSGLSADNGSVSDNGDGSFTITPNPGYTGPVELSYQVGDGQGGSANASQLFIVAPNGIDHEAAGTLSVLGTPEEGGSLTAALADVSDADGPTTIAYRWQEKSADVWVDLAAQADATLHIASDQSMVGREVRVVATTTDTQGGTTEFESPGQVITNVDDAATGLLAVGGIAEEGGTLSAGLSNAADVDDGIVGIHYQWQISDGTNWTDLAGATTAHYGIASDQSQVGSSLRVLVTTTDALGGTTTFIGDAPAPVANVNDLPTGAITITGTATEGQTLGLASTLADEDGLGTMSYQWLADDAAIAGATGNSLLLDHTLVGQAITVRASYIDAYGNAESMSSSATQPVAKMPGLTLTGTAGADILNGGGGDDILDGLAGGDQLNGFGGDDRLLGGSGNDALKGGDGNDQLDGGLGRDALDGGAGTDTASYTRSAKGVSVDLQTGKGSGGDAQGDSLVGIENLVGSAFADTLAGDAGANGLAGGAGNDILRGLGGADRLEGGSGADRFAFAALGDSGLGMAADLIVDFVHGSDRIDLSAIDANLLLRKDQAFNGTFKDLLAAFDAPGQLRFGYDTGNKITIVQGEVNGDGVADFEIHLVGLVDLTAADFVL